MATPVSDVNNNDVIRLVSTANWLGYPTPLTVQVCDANHLMKIIPAMGDIRPPMPQGKCVNFALTENAQKHVRIMPNASIDFEGGRGPWATFELCLPQPNGIALKCVGPHKTPQYLAMSPTGNPANPNELQLHSSTDPYHPSSRWSFQPVSDSAARAPVFHENVKLSDADLQFFAQEGYLICRNVVDPAQVDAALRAVNHHLGKGPEAWVEDEDNPGKFKLPASSHPAILGLFNRTYVNTLAHRLLGKDAFKNVGGGQLAIRFPVTDAMHTVDGQLVGASKEIAARDENTKNFHIDGQGKAHALPFSLLCKVALSDQSREGNGNFTVFPQSHRNQELIRWYHAALNGGKELVHQIAESRPFLGQPMQVCLNRGDCVFVHPFLAHRVGTNTSPNTRYSIIYRLHHNAFAEHAAQPEALEADPMFYFPWSANIGF